MAIDAKMRSHLGDAGHMMRSFRAIYANNPDGRPFSVKLHRYMWPGLWEKDFAVVICDPAGAEIARGEIGGEQESITVDVVPGATGGKGVYSIRLTKEGAHEVWLQCSLEQLVLDCGDWEQRSGRDETFDLYPIGMPRRWYFFVPEGVNEFRVSCAHGSAHRQDSGMVVFTPRGQPVAATYGIRIRDIGGPVAVRYRLRLPVGAVVGGDHVAGPHRVDQGAHRCLHVDQEVHLSSHPLHRRITTVQITGVEDSDVLLRMHHVVSAGGQIIPGMLAALVDLDLDGPQVKLEGAGELPQPVLLLVLVLRVADLHLVSGNVLGDRQVPGRGRIAILLIDRRVRRQTSDRHKQLLEAIPLAQLLESDRMGVIEVLMADEDIVEDRLGYIQMFAEQVRGCFKNAN